MPKGMPEFTAGRVQSVKLLSQRRGRCSPKLQPGRFVIPALQRNVLQAKANRANGVSDEEQKNSDPGPVDRRFCASSYFDSLYR